MSATIKSGRSFPAACTRAGPSWTTCRLISNSPSKNAAEALDHNLMIIGQSGNIRGRVIKLPSTARVPPLVFLRPARTGF